MGYTPFRTNYGVFYGILNLFIRLSQKIFIPKATICFERFIVFFSPIHISPRVNYRKFISAESARHCTVKVLVWEHQVLFICVYICTLYLNILIVHNIKLGEFISVCLMPYVNLFSILLPCYTETFQNVLYKRTLNLLLTSSTILPRPWQ